MGADHAGTAENNHRRASHLPEGSVASAAAAQVDTDVIKAIVDDTTASPHTGSRFGEIVDTKLRSHAERVGVI